MTRTLDSRLLNGLSSGLFSGSSLDGRCFLSGSLLLGGLSSGCLHNQDETQSINSEENKTYLGLLLLSLLGFLLFLYLLLGLGLALLEWSEKLGKETGALGPLGGLGSGLNLNSLLTCRRPDTKK